MSYILPVLLAFILHLAIAVSLLYSQWSNLEQSREMPRHIKAQLFDIKKLSTTTKSEQSTAKDVNLAEEKKPEPVVEKKKEPAKEDKKSQQLEKDQLKKQQQDQAERQLQKQKKAEQRKREQQALKKDLEKKKAEVKKQRDIESKRKLAAKKKAQQEQQIKDKKRKESDAAKKLQQQQAEKKAVAAKKRKQDAAKKKKILAQKQKKQEQARIKSLQRQIADEERYAAEQIAAEMATGVQDYINSLVKKRWHIPGTARDGIKAIVRIRLSPTGRVEGAEIVESSGNVAFDRSAEQAVWRTGNFPKVAEIYEASPAYFNRELRSFTMGFTNVKKF
ncbi:MAG: hypothetical protein OFPI_20910 [Osedax symbiont Rs2]|nr:MAG: hypothetical protein OFPI_20910 [Osedax symbiont Rs2]